MPSLLPHDLCHGRSSSRAPSSDRIPVELFQILKDTHLPCPDWSCYDSLVFFCTYFRGFNVCQSHRSASSKHLNDLTRLRTKTAAHCLTPHILVSTSWRRLTLIPLRPSLCPSVLLNTTFRLLCLVHHNTITLGVTTAPLNYSGK